MNHIELNNEITMRGEDGFFQLHKDKEAVEAFRKELETKKIKFKDVEEKINYMINNDYYFNVLEQYTMDQIKKIYSTLYAYNFKFQSYMAISKFYKDYALKTNDKKFYLESYEDRIAIVSLFLGQGNFNKAKSLAVSMIEQRYQPATPTFLNAGRSRRGEMVSCFLLEMDDSLNSIGFNINTAMQLSKIGGGVALNLSKLRGRKEQIKGIDDAASGVVPVMKLLEDSFSYANQLGQRKGAGAVYLNIFHWDIIEFLDTKKINADEKARIQSLSIGLIAEKIFFQLAKRNEEMYVFAPHSVYRAYGEHLDDMDLNVMYDKLVKNPAVKKRKLNLTAREMLIKIAIIQLESGYPYFMYKTNANDTHALKDIGQVKMSNLCTEIFQLQETSTINNYGTDDEIKRDINCNLGSLNIVNVMELKAIRDSVHAGVEALTSVSDITSIENAPTVKKANDELHAIGLGSMNLHGWLAKNKINYESPEALDFVRTFYMAVNYYSIEKSMMIAKETGVKFKDFERSEYAKGTYFAKYLKNDYSPRTEKIKQMFDGIEIPSQSDWENLMFDVKKYGLYHAYRLATAPTQSISYIQNATPSVMPIVDHIEARTYANSTTYYPMPYLSLDTFWYYKSAYNTNQFKLIDIIAEMQEHVDQGISTILYVNSDITTSELARYYIYASEKGLKSLYYTRTNNLGVNECETCSV
ncbi:ribonucleotide reductase large subunit [Bacillus phage G]|uniref:Ribonucleoside-diphosphate reductase n=1 Tax=Bacillus phage G TaxID=2884420 RepID=G3MBF2_9CAUD|nr:ribonucleotide reductase large subunit [Bacillus phage G]AEO93353.1 gp82 [Bacillus phage G]